MSKQLEGHASAPVPLITLAACSRGPIFCCISLYQPVLATGLGVFLLSVMNVSAMEATTSSALSRVVLTPAATRCMALWAQQGSTSGPNTTKQCSVRGGK
jgi:hypothetical protein